MGHLRHLKLVVCPGCHHMMKVPFSLIGKTFHCSKCNKALKVVSRRDKIIVQSQKENHVKVEIKNLPEKRTKFVKLMKKILKRIKNVLRICPNKDL